MKRISIGYKPASAVQVGTIVVQGNLVGVAKGNISANVTGQLMVTGVVRAPKATGVSTAMSVGELVYWDAATGEVTLTVGTNVLVGKVVHAAGDNDHFVRVLLTP